MKLKKSNYSLMFGAAAFLSVALIGQNGIAASGDGYNWNSVNSRVSANLHQVSVAVDGTVVVSGENGTLLTLKDGKFEELAGWSDYRDAPSANAVWKGQLAVTAVSANEIWIASYESHGEWLQADGSGNYNARGTGTTQRTTRLVNYKNSQDQPAVAGARGNGFLSRRNPSGATSQIQVGSAIYLDIAAYDHTNIWAVSGSQIARSVNNAGAWTAIAGPGDARGSFSAVETYNATSALIGTTEGDLFYWFNGDFQLLHGFDFRINSIYARDANNIWIAGNGGNFYYYNGVDAEKIDLGTTSHLNYIDGNADEIWIVGTNGSVYTTAAIPEASSVFFVVLVLAAFLGRFFHRHLTR